MESELILSRRLAEMLPIGERFKVNGIHYCANCRFCVSYLSAENRRFELDFENTYGEYVKTKTLNYFDYNKKGKLTAWELKNGEQPVNNEGKWKKDGRIEIKPSKLVSLLGKWIYFKEEGTASRYNPGDEMFIKLYNAFLELFSNKIKGIGEELNPKISSNVTDVYAMQTSDMSCGNLGSSCMRPESAHGVKEHIDLFKHIPCLRVLYGVDNAGKLLYRALLWYVRNEGEYKVFMDRPYCSDHIAEKLYDLAESKNWLYRKISSSLVLDDKLILAEVGYDFGEYAYNDGTLYFDTLNVYEHPYLSNFGNGINMQSCEGESIYDMERDLIQCYQCGDSVDRDESVYLEEHDHDLCEECSAEHCISCESCNDLTYNTETFSVRESNSPYNITICRYCMGEHVHLCEECGVEVFGSLEQVMRNGREIYICEYCYSEETNTCEECSDVCVGKCTCETVNV